LEQLHIPYILRGKLQTDQFEKRFGKYRSLYGCNYNVSYRQVIESEQKLRIKKILRFVRKNKVTLNTMKEHHFEDDYYVNVEQFIFILSSNYLEVCELDLGTSSYVCGYASSSVCKLISCSFWQELIKEAKGNGNGICSKYFFSHACITAIYNW
jgi:hypothetical protein